MEEPRIKIVGNLLELTSVKNSGLSRNRLHINEKRCKKAVKRKVAAIKEIYKFFQSPVIKAVVKLSLIDST
jgi:hypothetical protein